MERLPDHPVIRWMERTGYPPRYGARPAARCGEERRREDDDEELYGDPAQLP